MPASLSRQTVAAVPAPITDDEFSASQVDFIHNVFAYAEHLREHGRSTPLSDAFLGAFVGLLEVIDMNSREDAVRCTSQFREIVALLVPDATPDAEPAGAPPAPPSK
ncbi:hypothetical protein AB4851_10035 [Burkholderia sp. 22PA0099]|uniref:hypothetical protein n=1 Tax=Burkholderia sp. 22PA0099 TaxID=3237372 RepID=UPI0039C4A11D